MCNCRPKPCGITRTSSSSTLTLLPAHRDLTGHQVYAKVPVRSRSRSRLVSARQTHRPGKTRKEATAGPMGACRDCLHTVTGITSTQEAVERRQGKTEKEERWQRERRRFASPSGQRKEGGKNIKLKVLLLSQEIPPFARPRHREGKPQERPPSQPRLLCTHRSAAFAVTKA